MLKIDDLRHIVILKNLTDEMLHKLIPLSDIQKYKKGEFVFRGGESSKHFFLLKRGKILLEKRLSESITVSVGSIKPGYSFGWSSMLGGNAYTSDAICAETSEVFALDGTKLIETMQNDHSMAYGICQILLRVMKSRLDLRTEQFLHVLTHHPEIGNLLENK
ncbi:cyclic nucleotide-binding domain-containing protein [Desulfobacterales bacterium HSG17]|nr:cyclic nucleotide-binding domain-containing protein [Desulfobacterales bacterium HSG17]